jgi:hypothetical protein
MGAQRRVVVECFKIGYYLLRRQVAAHMMGQHGYPGCQERSASSEMREYEVDIRELALLPRYNEVGSGFEGFVRYLRQALAGRAEQNNETHFDHRNPKEGMRIWSGGGDFGSVEENRGSAIVELFPNGIESIIRDIYYGSSKQQ